MTQVATVQRILSGGMAEIAVPRKSACGHDCEECAGCGVTGAAILAKAANPVQAEPGDKVVVESSTKSVLGIIALVYCVPVALFLVGYFATASIVGSETARSLCAVLGFALGLVPAVLYDRHLRKTGSIGYTITRTLS